MTEQPNSEGSDRKCKTCFYCKKYEVPNLERHLLSNRRILPETFLAEVLPETDIYYKCHIQGPPTKVHPEYDWCYQWRLKE
jgi:hypothetical protein